MSAPIVYTSADGGAPTMDGTSGGLCTLLNACLVTGYGAKAAAGWTRPFTSGVESSFQQGGGNQMFLYVNGTTAFNSTGMNAGPIRGYESMSAVSTGTDPFPTVAQLAGGIGVMASVVNGVGPARPWVLVADDRTFYLLIDTAGSGVYEVSLCFGDLYSYKTGDSYRTFIGGSTNTIFGGRCAMNYTSGTFTVSQASGGLYIARDHLGTGKSILSGSHADTSVGVVGALGSSTRVYRGTLPYPNPAGDEIWLAPVYLHDPNYPVNRGKFRGIWQWMHQTSGIADRDTFNGTGEFAGKTFLVVKVIGFADTGGSTNTGVYIFETSNTWLTSS